MVQYTGLLKLSRWSLQRLTNSSPIAFPDESQINLIIPLFDFTPNILTHSIGSCVVTGHAGMKATATGLAITNIISN